MTNDGYSFGEIVRRLDRIEGVADRSRSDFSNASVTVSNLGIHIAQLQREIAEEKAARERAIQEAEADIKEVHDRMDDYIRSQVVKKSTAFYSGYLPSILALLAIAATVFLTLWGTP